MIGGATIAPALTVENTLVGRIAPAAMLNEAYTWVVTVSVGGQRRRRRGGRRDRRPAGRAAVGVRLRGRRARGGGAGRRGAGRADRPRGPARGRAAASCGRHRRVICRVRVTFSLD